MRCYVRIFWDNMPQNRAIILFEDGGERRRRWSVFAAIPTFPLLRAGSGGYWRTGPVDMASDITLYEGQEVTLGQGGTVTSIATLHQVDGFPLRIGDRGPLEFGMSVSPTQPLPTWEAAQYPV